MTETNNHADAPVVLGLIGHVRPLFLEDVKKEIEKVPHFKLIFSKESSGKLWIVGDEKHD